MFKYIILEFKNLKQTQPRVVKKTILFDYLYKFSYGYKCDGLIVMKPSLNINNAHLTFEYAYGQNANDKR